MTMFKSPDELEKSALLECPPGFTPKVLSCFVCGGEKLQVEWCEIERVKDWLALHKPCKELFKKQTPLKKA